MPRKYMMSWEPKGRRWWKQVHGKRLVISCRQLQKLGLLALGVESKEGSYRAANEWLSSQLGISRPNRFQSILDALAARRQWLLDKGEDVADIDEKIRMVKDMAEWPEMEDGQFDKVVQFYAGTIGLQSNVWNDRLQREPPRTIDTDKRISFHIDKFLALRQQEVDAGQLHPSTYRQTEFCLRQWREFMPASIDSIDSDRWVAWYKEILARRLTTGKKTGEPLSYEHKKKLFSYPRAFIEWLIEQDLVRPFQSLKSRRYRFATDRAEVEPLTVEQVRSIIDKAKGILRLHLMLMLNCGMTQTDISNLKVSEYKDGRITRRRSKTERQGTRVVSWMLWPETLVLIEQYGHKEGERLLLTSNGTVWVDHKKDSVASLYNKLATGIPMKRLRQTSGDYIHKQFGNHVADHFLAHGTQDGVERSYFSRDQAALDEATEWLRNHYFG